MMGGVKGGEFGILAFAQAPGLSQVPMQQLLLFLEVPLCHLGGFLSLLRILYRVQAAADGGAGSIPVLAGLLAGKLHMLMEDFPEMPGVMADLREGSCRV